MKHEDYNEMIAAAALDALDGDERGALDSHLAGCARCRAELEALRDATTLLAYATPAAVATSPELRARILTAITAQPQEGRRGENAQDGASTPMHTAGVTSSEEFATRREAREAGVSRRVVLFGSLAASIAVAALLLSLATLWQRNNRLQGELARLADTVKQTQQELARTREDRELLALPAARSAPLAGTKVAEKAHGRLTFDAQTGRAMFMAAELPPVPEGKAYQLWFIAEGKPPMPGSVFRPDPTGHAEMHETVPPEGRRAAIYAVTLEPAGGVSAPTGEMYLKSSTS